MHAQVVPCTESCRLGQARGRAACCWAAEDSKEPQPAPLHVRRYRQAPLAGLLHQGVHSSLLTLLYACVAMAAQRGDAPSEVAATGNQRALVAYAVTYLQISSGQPPHY